MAVKYRQSYPSTLLSARDMLLIPALSSAASSRRLRRSIPFTVFVHILNTRLARTIPTVEKSSVTQFYLEKSAGHRIRAHIHDNDQWMDVGKFEEFHNLLS